MKSLYPPKKEVDCEVLVPPKKAELKVGEFYEVKITKAEEFDLYGEIE